MKTADDVKLRNWRRDEFFLRADEVKGDLKMNRSSRWWVTMAAFVLTVAFLNLDALAAGKPTILTGEVGDSMCGRKHMEDEPAAECTRACVAHGSKYALIVGDKIYTLDTADKTALDTLDKQAGKQATVTGSVEGDTVSVSSVTAK